ncbi:C40 family peptidase [Algoriphagus sp.]|uniref:C40 family peptidase n=1 Tax=Algoriphagus sp. TaxID=1872435 RepID=UPI00391CA515
MGEDETTEIRVELNSSLDTKPSLRDSLEDFGKELLGVPYIYAGSSRAGFDCSGFVHYVFKNFGISVPRSSSQFSDFGEEVALDLVQKGDILVFLSPTRDEIGHLGIVINPNGMETEFIHASSGKEMQVVISSLKQPNYNRRFVKAIKVIEE